MNSMGIIKSHLIAPNSQEGSRSGQLITKQILDYSEERGRSFWILLGSLSNPGYF